MHLAEYDNFFITCEGANEEAAFNYILNNQRLSIDENRCYLDNIRVHTKAGRKKLLNKVLEHNFNGRTAILDIKDRRSESWSLTRTEKMLMKNNQVEILPVITYPEIEILLIILDDACWKMWINRRNKEINPSGFCKQYYRCDVKKADAFIEQFCNFGAFVDVCFQYKSRFAQQGELTLYDLIK